MNIDTAKYGDPVSRLIGNALDKTKLSARTKLIIVFLIAKIVPMIILASIAWNQFLILGDTVREKAVDDATKALNDSAVENIERMTTDTARNVADFLYERDNDILYAATLTPDKSSYSRFIKALTSGVVDPGTWALAEDGMSWIQSRSARDAGDKAESTNEENLDNEGWRSRPAEGFRYNNIPLFDEITFVDTEGQEQVKVVSKSSTKKRYPMDPDLKDITKRKNTYVKSEEYWRELKALRPGEIYVSDVKGAYTPSHFIGMYTPKQMVITAINGLVTELESAEEQPAGAEQLAAALTAVKDNDIVGIKTDNTSHDTMMKSVIAATMPLIDKASSGISGELMERVMALKDKISEIKFDPENEAYAGEENPLGNRFEGIVRWATPVTDPDGSITGYVTLALNHDHIMEFVDHQTPLSERYADLPSAFDGNYAFIWDYNCRSICHPRHHSIYGSDPGTGLEQIPWLETSIYESLLERVGGDDLDDLKAAWPEVVNDPQPTDTDGVHLLLNGVPVFDDQSRSKKPAPPLTADGLVGLDGRYLNNAPQCTGWMDLTRDGGSGSFYILWSGLYKLTTAAAIPYYTGQYAPSADNGWSKRGFAMVTIGAGLEDFSAPARETRKALSALVGENINDMMLRLLITTGFLIALVILIAIWLANWITNNITRLISGIRRFRSGERHFRFKSDAKDEFGMLANSLDDMADSIVDSVKDPLCILDLSNNIIYMNEGGLMFSGARIDEVLGKPYKDYSVYPAGTQYDPIKALEDGTDSDIYYNECTETYLKGVASWFLDIDGNKQGYIVLSKDVTDMVMRQVELERAVNSANVANMHKGEFLARMSHEIRTPMNAIMGITNITLNQIKNGTFGSDDMRDIERHLRRIETSSRHLLGLLNDILDISKIEAGKIDILSERMDLVKTAETVENIIRPRCEEKGITFNVNIDKFEPSTFMSDELRLRQVLINLLGNAVKFTSEHGDVFFSVENIGARDGAVDVRFTVRDTGIGIPEEVIDKIFEPFEQAESGTTGKYGGTGLGLAISNSIVNLMGGDIKVESAVGEGSSFTFVISMQEVAGSVAGNVSYNDGIGKFKGMRAMVVDDIEVNRMVVSGLLEETGISIEEASDGVEAVEKFSSSADGYYDIIFMDVQMPRMDGYSAASIIRAMQGRNDAMSITIVALTANAFTDDIERSKNAGMNTHVAKPVDADRLVEVLFEYLGESEQAPTQ